MAQHSLSLLLFFTFTWRKWGNTPSYLVAEAALAPCSLTPSPKILPLLCDISQVVKCWVLCWLLWWVGCHLSPPGFNKSLSVYWLPSLTYSAEVCYNYASSSLTICHCTNFTNIIQYRPHNHSVSDLQCKNWDWSYFSNFPKATQLWLLIPKQHVYLETQATRDWKRL